MKQGQKNPKNIVEATNILQTQTFFLFEYHSSSKEKQSSLIAAIEKLLISPCILHCSIVSTLLRCIYPEEAIL